MRSQCPVTGPGARVTPGPRQHLSPAAATCAAACARLKGSTQISVCPVLVFQLCLTLCDPGL